MKSSTSLRVARKDSNQRSRRIYAERRRRPPDNAATPVSATDGPCHRPSVADTTAFPACSTSGSSRIADTQCIYLLWAESRLYSECQILANTRAGVTLAINCRHGTSVRGNAILLPILLPPLELYSASVSLTGGICPFWYSWVPGRENWDHSAQSKLLVQYIIDVHRWVRWRQYDTSVRRWRITSMWLGLKAIIVNLSSRRSSLNIA